MKNRMYRAAFPLALLAPLAACSGAPAPGETTERAAAALDPSNVIPPTTYVVTMWVDANEVLDATADPPSDPPSLAGTCYPTSAGACQDNCQDWSCYTADTGYKLWGELSARVGTYVDGQIVYQNAQSSSCALSTPPGLGATTWDPALSSTNPNTATMNMCEGTGLQNGGANGAFQGGQPLTLPVSISDPSNVVQFAAVLDNIESTSPSSVPASSAPSILSTYTGGLSALGTLVTLASGATTPLGAVSGVITFVNAIAGLTQSSSPSMPGQSITCAGGMYPEANGAASDTLVFSLTGAQLEQAAQPGVGELTYQTNGGWEATSDGRDHCSANLTIHVDVQRAWSNGLAAAPRSGDFAIVSSPTQMDAFIVPQTAPAGADTSQQFVRVYGDGNAWSQPAATDGYPTSYTSSSGEWALGSGPHGALVQTAVPNSNGMDEFFFWANGEGVLMMAPFNHANTQVTFADAYFLFNQTYQATPVCILTPFGERCSGGGTQNLVPNNAHVAAVSRAASNLDAFFIDATGNLRNEYSGDGGKTWGNVQITNGSPGIPGSPVSAVAQTNGSLDVFFLGYAGLDHATWSAGAPWAFETVLGTSNLATPGGYLAATAQTVSDLDVFFTDASGYLWRATKAPPAQPSFLVGRVSPSATTPDATSAGPVAAVSREPGLLDVVTAPPAGASTPTWYSMGAGGAWTRGSLPSMGPVAGISIVAPSSAELRVFAGDSWSNLYTTDWVSAGAPAWTGWDGIEVLTKAKIVHAGL